MTAPPLETIMRSGPFDQRMYVRKAIGAAKQVLSPSVAKIVISELESIINLGETFPASPLALSASAELIEQAGEGVPKKFLDT